MIDNSKFEGLTVNERLFKANCLNQFDKAVESKNRKLIIDILKSVDLDEESIEDILEHYDLNE